MSNTKFPGRARSFKRFQKSLGIGILILVIVFPSHASTVLSFFSGAGNADAVVSFINREGRAGDFIVGGCSTCITAVAPISAGPYDFNLSDASTPYSPTAPTFGATPVAGTSFWTEALDGGDSFFGVSLGSNSLISAFVSEFSIFAVPSHSSALIELTLTNAFSNITSLSPASTYYLDISGATDVPVTISTRQVLNYTFTTFDSFDIDWSAALNTTPYSPVPTSPVPEPETALLLAVGLIGLIAKRRMRRG